MPEEQDKKKEKTTYAVLSKKLAGGPHGLGKSFKLISFIFYLKKWKFLGYVIIKSVL